MSQMDQPLSVALVTKKPDTGAYYKTLLMKILLTDVDFIKSKQNCKIICTVMMRYNHQ